MNERIAVKVFQIFQGSFDLCIPGVQLVQLVQVISHVTRCWPRRAIRYCIPISTQNGFVCTIQMKTCCREKLEGHTSGGLFQIGKRFGCAIFNESWQVEPRFSRDAVERKYSKLGSKNRQGQHLNAVEVWSVTSALGACGCLVHDRADGF